MVGLNDSGVVAGTGTLSDGRTTVVTYKDGLTTFWELPLDIGWAQVSDINNAGQIIGQGEYRGSGAVLYATESGIVPQVQTQSIGLLGYWPRINENGEFVYFAQDVVSGAPHLVIGNQTEVHQYTLGPPYTNFSIGYFWNEFMCGTTTYDTGSGIAYGTFRADLNGIYPGEACPDPLAGARGIPNFSPLRANSAGDIIGYGPDAALWIWSPAGEFFKVPGTDNGRLIDFNARRDILASVTVIKDGSVYSEDRLLTSIATPEASTLTTFLAGVGLLAILRSRKISNASVMEPR